MGLSVGQCRAARALLNWTIGELAEAAAVGVMTVNRFESGTAVSAASMEAIASALTRAGVTLLAAGEASSHGGEGARLNVDQPPRR